MQTLQQLMSGELAGCTRLKLSCDLTTFPEAIFDLADTLEVLDLSQNRLAALPADFARLSKLKILFLSDNLFTRFPDVLATCPQLEMIGFKANQISYLPEHALPVCTRWLILTDNRIPELPASIGQCERLQKLMLAGNRLVALPDTLANCRNLQLLRIAANQIQVLPDWLWKMPKLYWLAFAGNPCQAKPVTTPDTLTDIQWQALEPVCLLGEGASGIISKAIWRHKEAHTAMPDEVAIKVFKGAVTSDGMPADEMEACVAAGDHPHLVKLLGKIRNHPAGRQGLVLELIPAAFTNLGGPPNFATCTRDVFADGTAFTPTAILRIATGIADAVAHLHQRGILHGDLYAHNILTDERHYPLFGDFGAATSYDRTNQELSARLQRLEAGAFGCLLADLLPYAAPDAEEVLLEQLIRLQQHCHHAVVSERPCFSSIVKALADMKEIEED